MNRQQIPAQVRAKAQFLTWAHETFPDLYEAVLTRVAEENAHLAGLGQEETQSWWQKAATAFTALGTTYLGLKNQRDIMKINLQRAQMGQAPISGEDLTAPVVQTRIDLDPDTVAKLTQGAGMQVNKILLFGGIALVGVLLLMRNK